MFEADVQQFEKFTFVKIHGTIDEDNELLALSSRIQGPLLVVHLGAIQEMNSCGVRDWLKWREEIQNRGIRMALVECSPAVVAKLNSVSNFNEGGYLRSFYVPYFCQACEMEKVLLVDIDEIPAQGVISVPICRCDSCDGVMAFDDHVESYFCFLRDARKAAMPEEIRSVLEQLAPSGGERKILPAMMLKESSFAGIVSTASSGDFSQRSGSFSAPSIKSLKRLQDRHRLRIADKAKANPTGRPDFFKKKAKWIGLAAALLIFIALAIFVGLRFR